MVMKINDNFTTYPLLNQLQSISSCTRPTTVSTEPLKVSFTSKKCNSSIIENPALCNKSTPNYKYLTFQEMQGFYVCLYS